MLGRCVVHGVDRGVEVARAVPADARHVSRANRVGDHTQPAGVVADKRRESAGAVLGLREQIERERDGVGIAGRDGDELARTLERIDADVRRHEPFRGSGVGIARADDLVHPCHRASPVSERRDRGRPTRAVEDCGPDELERISERGIERTVGRHGRRDHELAHARDLRRHAGHQRGRRVRRPPARHERSDALERCGHEPELSRRVAARRLARSLTRVEGADARVREVERAANVIGARTCRAAQRGGLDDQILRARAGSIETADRPQHRGVAAATDRADDRRRRVAVRGTNRSAAASPIHVGTERRER